MSFYIAMTIIFLESKKEENEPKNWLTFVESTLI